MKADADQDAVWQIDARLDDGPELALFRNAMLLMKQGQNDAAAEKFMEKFAEAARAEEIMHESTKREDLPEEAFVHGFHAAWCWANACNFYRAITLCQSLLDTPGLPERLRLRVQQSIDTFHARRAFALAGLSPDTTEREA